MGAAARATRKMIGCMTRSRTFAGAMERALGVGACRVSSNTTSNWTSSASPLTHTPRHRTFLLLSRFQAQSIDKRRPDVVQNRHAHAHRGQPDRRPSWLLLDPHTTRQSLPLPRGPSQQLALQPLDQVLCPQILGLHG